MKPDKPLTQQICAAMLEEVVTARQKDQKYLCFSELMLSMHHCVSSDLFVPYSSSLLRAEIYRIQEERGN